MEPTKKTGKWLIYGLIGATIAATVAAIVAAHGSAKSEVVQVQRGETLVGEGTLTSREDVYGVKVVVNYDGSRTWGDPDNIEMALNASETWCVMPADSKLVYTPNSSFTTMRVIFPDGYQDRSFIRDSEVTMVPSAKIRVTSDCVVTRDPVETEDGD